MLAFPSHTFRTAVLLFSTAVVFLVLVTAYDSAIYRIEAEEACAELGGKMDWSIRRCKNMTRSPKP